MQLVVLISILHLGGNCRIILVGIYSCHWPRLAKPNPPLVVHICLEQPGSTDTFLAKLLVIEPFWIAQATAGQEIGFLPICVQYLATFPSRSWELIYISRFWKMHSTQISSIEKLTHLLLAEVECTRPAKSSIYCWSVPEVRKIDDEIEQQKIDISSIFVATPLELLPNMVRTNHFSYNPTFLTIPVKDVITTGWPRRKISALQFFWLSSTLDF